MWETVVAYTQLSDKAFKCKWILVTARNKNQQISIKNVVINSSVFTDRAVSGRTASELGSLSFESQEGHRLYYLRPSWCS